MVNLKGLRVYLDANTVIYAVEGLASFTNLRAGLLAPLDAGDLLAVTSELTLIETITGPRKTGNVEDESAFRRLLTPSVNLSMMPLTLPIIERVIELRQNLATKHQTPSIWPLAL